MWRFFAPDYNTAKDIIELYNLKKNMTEPHFQVFSGRNTGNEEIELIISGTGQVKAAMAAGYIMSGKSVEERDILICIEPVGEQSEECTLCCEIHDAASGKYYYPDMCPVHPFDETSSCSGEFAAWYETLTCFAMQHQLVFARLGKNAAQALGEFLEGFYNAYEKRHPFHHVYVERSIKGDKTVQGVLGKLRHSRVVWTNHYKDVFNRKKQSLKLQKLSPALILAKKTGQLVYPGSKECQSFGNSFFYYTSSMMNCLFDCEYCYLQGMYPSADIVLFTNIEDIFAAVDELLTKHPVYLCISYDTDMAALEALTGYCRRWIDYAVGCTGLTIELRTKAEMSEQFVDYCREKVCENIIFAFTLTPDMIKLSYEHNTPSANARITAMKRAAGNGLKVRACFDPLIIADCPWEDNRTAYVELIGQLFDRMKPHELYDVSLGEFRVPCDYLKRMRKKRPESKLLNYPFAKENDSFCYGSAGQELADYVENVLLNYLPAEKIYRWR